MTKSAKQALLAELTDALASVVPATPSPLPNSIAHAIDNLADSILRWQARQMRPNRPTSRRGIALSDSDTLASLLDARLHEEAETVSNEVVENPDAAVPPPNTTSLPVSSIQKKPRPRLSKPRSPNV